MSNGLSRTLTNVYSRHDFSKIIVNYTPYQQAQKQYGTQKAKSKSNTMMMTNK